jgi:two-component system chemotaxis response regulator CheY
MEPQASVLVIDDEPGIVDSIRFLLKQKNLDVQSAGHGDEAIDMLNAGYIPHLILCDLNMPKMHGTDFVKRAIQLNAPTPIAILSAHLDQEKIIECMELGTVGYFVKPFEAKTFLEKVNVLIEIGKNRLGENSVPADKSKEDIERELRLKFSAIKNSFFK